MANRNVYYIVFAWLVFFTCFFDMILLSNRYVKYVCLLLLAVFYFISPKSHGWTKRLIGLSSIFVLLSCLYSFKHHHQPLLAVINASYPYFGLVFFCVLLYYRPSYIVSVKLVKAFSVLFCCCYLIQYILYPIPIFTGVLNEESVNVDQFRMRMTCSLCSYCLFFLGLNCFFYSRKILYIGLSILGFIPIIIMGFRSLVVLSLLGGCYIFVKMSRRSMKSFMAGVVVVSCVVFIALQTSLVQNKIMEMKARQESNQTFDNDEYIRYASFTFYVNDVFVDPIGNIIGNGVPLVPINPHEKGAHYTQIIDAGFSHGLYWNDLGLVGLSFVIGPISLLIIIFVMILTSIRCDNAQLLFIRCTIMTGIMGSIFTSQEIYRAGNFVFIALLIYTYYIYNIEKIDSQAKSAKITL